MTLECLNCLHKLTHTHDLINFFKALSIHYRCAIPGWPGGDTYAVQSPEHAAAINALIPFDNGNGESTLSSCLIHEYTNASPSSIMNASVSSTPVACTEWVYDKSVFEHTAVSQVMSNTVCSFFLSFNDISYNFCFCEWDINAKCFI